MGAFGVGAPSGVDGSEGGCDVGVDAAAAALSRPPELPRPPLGRPPAPPLALESRAVRLE